MSETFQVLVVVQPSPTHMSEGSKACLWPWSLLLLSCKNRTSRSLLVSISGGMVEQLLVVQYLQESWEGESHCTGYL